MKNIAVSYGYSPTIFPSFFSLSSPDPCPLAFFQVTFPFQNLQLFWEIKNKKHWLVYAAWSLELFKSHNESDTWPWSSELFRIKIECYKKRTLSSLPRTTSKGQIETWPIPQHKTSSRRFLNHHEKSTHSWEFISTTWVPKSSSLFPSNPWIQVSCTY